MRQESIPELNFSFWYKWRNRSEYDKKDCPGIYLIAISTKDLDRSKPKWSDVVYIGMTNSRGGLKSRWKQFENSIEGKSGHSGGYRIYEDPELGKYNEWAENLYVSAMGIECAVASQEPAAYKTMGYIAFLEYDAFAEYATAMKDYPDYPGRPKYNKK